jgi:hypothetical protein
MIKELIESGYRKTIGALWRSVSSIAGGWGVVQILYVLVLVGLMAGFVNADVLPVSNQAQAVYPGAGNQTYAETFIDAMVILLGASGIYLTYISGRQTTKSRMVNLYLGFALLLICVTMMTGIYLVNVKG